MNKKILFLSLILILSFQLASAYVDYDGFESGSLNTSKFSLSAGTGSVVSSLFANTGTYSLRFPSGTNNGVFFNGSSVGSQDYIGATGKYIVEMYLYIDAASATDAHEIYLRSSTGTGCGIVSASYPSASTWGYYDGSWKSSGITASSGDTDVMQNWARLRILIDNDNYKFSYRVGNNSANTIWNKTTAGLACGASTPVRKLSDVGIYHQNAYIDDIKIWNYDTEGGWDYTPPITDPEYISPSPANDSTNNTQVTFNINCSSDNVFVWFDGNLIINNETSPANFTTNETNSSIHTVDAACYNLGSGLFSSNLTRIWTYDVIYPAINFNNNNAFNQFNYSQISQYLDEIFLNISFSDDIDLYAYSINITKNGGAVILFNETNEGISGLSYNYTNTINTSSWQDGIYDIKIMVSDSHTANEIKPYNVKKEDSKLEFNTAEGFNIFLDSEDQSITDSVKYKDRYDFRFDFLDGLKKNRVFNLRSDYPIIYRANSKYKGHFIIFDGFKGNWVDFEGVSGEVSIKKISDYHYKITIKDVPPKVKFESIGGLNILTANQQWYKGSASLDAPASGVSEPVELTLELSRHSSQDNFSAFLVYNGSSYPVASKVDDGSTVTFNQSFTSPASDAVYSYYWNVTYNQTDGSIINFALNGTHEVFNYSVFNCTSGNKTLNLNFFNENVPANSLITTAEVDLDYWISDKDNAREFLYKFTGGSSYSICIEPSITLYMDLYVQYSTTSGFTHRYYLFNQTISNVTQNISMYNFNTTTGVSDLKITARNIKTYNALDQIVGKLQRNYLSEGVWRTVQMDLSGDYGTIFFNVLEENTDYRLLYYDTNNNLLKQTETLKFVCVDGICDLTQLINPDVSVATTSAIVVSSVLDNSTNILSVTWTDPQANNNKVEVRVTKETLTGTSVICDVFQTGSSGSVNCDLSGFTDDVLLTVLTSHSPYTPIKSAWISLGKNKLSSMISLREGSFWTFGFMITSVAFGLFSPVGAIIAGLIGLIGIFFLGIFNPITTTFIIISAAMGVAIGIKVRQ